MAQCNPGQFTGAGGVCTDCAPGTFSTEQMVPQLSAASALKEPSTMSPPRSDAALVALGFIRKTLARRHATSTVALALALKPRAGWSVKTALRYHSPATFAVNRHDASLDFDTRELLKRKIAVSSKAQLRLVEI
ncbi:hypothetical protein EYR36_005190 [Pleurotus pulmonarius]|nr:hypothetical protein EYR36_005190 [Pleurotus pulmonarius]